MKRLLLTIGFLLIFLFSFSYKYIFLFIADGMGIPHLQLTNMYKENKYGEKLNMMQLPYFALVETSSLNGVTDSAAAITAILSGERTYNDMINTKGSKTLTPLTYLLKNDGYQVGVISTNSLVDATPAGAYAFVENRRDYQKIVQDLLKSNFDLFIGGGRAYFDKDEVERYGYSYSEILPQTVIPQKEILALYYGNFPFLTDNEQRITLEESLKYALKKFGEDPFFLLIEGGRIDHAAHAHDTYSMIKEIIDLDDAVKVALEFYESNPKDTLIIVTSDHATGGLSLGDGYLSLNKIKENRFSYEKMINVFSSTQSYSDFKKNLELLEDLEEEFYASKNSTKNITYQSEIIKNYYDSLNNLIGLSWGTFGHTIDYVPLFSNISNDAYLIKNNEIFYVFEIF